MDKQQIEKWIKEAHDNAIERGFYQCPECYGPDGVPEYGTEKYFCEHCNSTGIDPNKNIGELLMLIVSELGEALEAHRCGRFAFFCKDLGLQTDHDWENIGLRIETDYKEMIKDTFEDEIADVFIRLFDLCGYLGIEPDGHRIIIDDIKFWDNLSSSENISEILIRLTRSVINIHEYGYEFLKNKRYVENTTEFFNAIFFRLNRFCDIFNIPIEKHITAKMAYNRARPHKHGKEY